VREQAKLGHTSTAGAENATVEAMGLPVPAVWGVQEVGGRWGIVFDRVSGASFAERMQQDPSLAPECPEILAQLHALIHTHPAHEAGGGRPQ
jgi:hypothetical protein